MPKQLRILYAIGPENVMEAYTCWKENRDCESQVSVAFSSQFYDVCQDLNASCYVIARSDRKELVKNEGFIVECCPFILSGSRGILFHLGYIGNGLLLLLKAIRFGANVVVVDSGTTYWFVLSLFCWFGIKVIPSLHCLLWRKYLPLRLIDRLNIKLSRNLFTNNSQAILVASEDISKQISELTKGKHRPILEFFSTYRRADFADISKSFPEHSPFQVLFAGRIEQNKGVFDLLEIAKRFDVDNLDIIFNICGEGSALEKLRRQALEYCINTHFICHGYCSKSQMREMYSRSHVVIVPTRTNFSEGFNRVVCESILSGRPVVTSGVCPALSYVREAVIEVPPNDVKAYGDALLRLYDDRELYEQKKQGCLILQEKFYDTTKSWGTALKSILLTMESEKRLKLTTNKIIGNS